MFYLCMLYTVCAVSVIIIISSIIMPFAERGAQGFGGETWGYETTGETKT